MCVTSPAKYVNCKSAEVIPPLVKVQYIPSTLLPVAFGCFPETVLTVKSPVPVIVMPRGVYPFDVPTSKICEPEVELFFKDPIICPLDLETEPLEPIVSVFEPVVIFPL